MRRLLLTSLAGLALAASPTGLGADEAAANAAAVAERQYAEERYKRLNSVVEDLLAAQAASQKRMAALTEEIHALREEQARSPARYASHEDLRKLAEKIIQELDRKREEDKKLILEELRKLAAAPAPAPEPPPKKTPPQDPEPSLPAKGYEYEIQRGDTLGAIVAAYQQKGVKVTIEQVRKANPKLKEKSLRVGQKVFIPDPAQP